MIALTNHHSSDVTVRSLYIYIYIYVCIYTYIYIYVCNSLIYVYIMICSSLTQNSKRLVL